MAKAKKLRVLITASQTVSYRQHVEMSQEEWDKLNMKEPKEAAQEIQEWLNLHDIYDSRDIEDDDFEAHVVTAKDKILDSYTGGETG